jgi:hypothetical protein
MNQHLIEQYVAGKMSEAEADAFEVSCVANPELARQVELEQRLKAGLTLVASGSTAEFVRSESQDGPGSWPSRPAFCCVLAPACGSGNTCPGAHPRFLPAVATEEQRQGTSMRLALVRGADSMPHCRAARCESKSSACSIPASTTPIALDRIGPHQNIATVATLYGQHPTSPVTLEVMIDGEQLDAGSYFLRVLKQASDEEALDFPFAGTDDCSSRLPGFR